MLALRQLLAGGNEIQRNTIYSDKTQIRKRELGKKVGGFVCDITRNRPRMWHSCII